MRKTQTQTQTETEAIFYHNGGATVSGCAGVFDRKSGGYFVPD